MLTPTWHSVRFKVYENITVLINGVETVVTGTGETRAEPKLRGLGTMSLLYTVRRYKTPFVGFFDEENLEYYKKMCSRYGFGIAANKGPTGAYIVYYPAMPEPPIIDTLGQSW
jgi:hypothetical protein